MIGRRFPLSQWRDRAIEDGIALFTTRMSNDQSEAAPTSVVDDIQSWMDEDSSNGGPAVQDDSIHYSVPAVLVAIYLLILAGRTVTQAAAMRALLLEMDDRQRQRLGMTGDLSHTRAALIAEGDGPNATAAQVSKAAVENKREYARFARFASRMATGFDPSPFAKGFRATRTHRGTATVAAG
jgi:hypothetical protein